jgi:osmotically-inducible protein OsmY
MSGQTATMAESPTTLIDDETLAQRVYRALEDIKPLYVLGSPLHVQVNDGVVTLRGVVGTPLCKAQIVKAVCSVPGVQEVSDELWM